jgi:hypothetical protein
MDADGPGTGDRWQSDSCRSAAVNADAINADTERRQPLALGMRSCRPFERPAPKSRSFVSFRATSVKFATVTAGKRVAECVERCVEALLTPPARLIVGFRGHEPDQLVQFVVSCRENDALAVGAHGEHDPFAVGIEQPQIPERRSHIISDDDLAERAGKSDSGLGEIPRPILRRRGTTHSRAGGRRSATHN